MSQDALNLDNSSKHNWLCDELSDYLTNLTGGLEHNQIIFMLKNSIRVRLSHDFVTSVSVTIKDRLSTIEDAISTINLHPQPLWLEYEHLARTKVFGKPDSVNGSDTITVGSLLMANPDKPEHVAIFNAWKTRAGDIYHSFALLHWDIERFKTPKVTLLESDINLRLMELASAQIPPNLFDTMVILNSLSKRPDLIEKAKRQTIQDILGEHVFLLGCIIMLSSSSIVMVPLDIEEDEEKEKDNLTQHWEARMALTFDLFSSLRKGGFRKGIGGQVVWSPIKEQETTQINV